MKNKKVFMSKFYFFKKILKGSIFFKPFRIVMHQMIQISRYKSINHRLKNLELELKDLKETEERNFNELFNFLMRVYPIEPNNSVHVETKFPVAYDSPDHLFPVGTANDNTTKPAFIEACYVYFNKKISYLDLGCAGGGIVRNFLEAGHFSIGIEGSDYSKKNKRAEWARIPSYLFTADLTKPLSFKKMMGCFLNLMLLVLGN